MNTISIAVVLLVFGAVACNCYAIDCMKIWDEDSLNEMLEDRRRVREALGLSDEPLDCCGDTGHNNDHSEEDHEDEGDDDNDDDEENSEEASEENVHQVRHKRDLPLSDVRQDILLAEAQDEAGDLEVAETHLFRPVFRYKSQYTERRRVRTPTDGNNFVPAPGPN
uniref:Putative secreted protein n=1 Tax=Anopheles darlingi TaxID=43151 RepID=A0A2M4CIX9_ANODA